MAGPVYKLFLAKPTAAYYQLSADEQRNFVAKAEAALAEVGGKRLVFCNSGWSSEQWPSFGVEEFPDIAAIQKFREALDALNLSLYLDSMTVLGTRFEEVKGQGG